MQMMVWLVLLPRLDVRSGLASARAALKTRFTNDPEVLNYLSSIGTELKKSRYVKVWLLEALFCAQKSTCS